MAEKVSESSRD